MPTRDEPTRYRLLTTEPAGNGRRRLLAATPARLRSGVWAPSDRTAVDDITREPCALEHPNGEVEEFGTGFRFDSRHDFLRARGAVA